MLLNRAEFALMNNPIRAWIQRRMEAARLLRLGGRMEGGKALEVGCGRGVGVGIIFDQFGATDVDAFDLDSKMVTLARRRVKPTSTRLWVGDCERLPIRDGAYDAVFDFGIIHHVPDWRKALSEVGRVLKPGGRFYAEEVLGAFITHPIIRRIFRHPQFDRFGAPEFRDGMKAAGLSPDGCEVLGGSFAWFTAVKPMT